MKAVGPVFQLIPLLLLTFGFGATFAEVPQQLERFLSERAPACLEGLRILEKESPEEFEDSVRELSDFRIEYFEIAEEEGEEFARLHLAMMDNDARIEILMYKFDQDRVPQEEAHRQIRELLKKQIQIQNDFSRRELEMLRREASDIEEDLQWRLEYTEEAL
ncbi:MAG: hypothetical protein AAF585_26590, partial [Verrucomicrobiota bacterium]